MSNLIKYLLNFLLHLLEAFLHRLSIPVPQCFQLVFHRLIEILG